MQTTQKKFNPEALKHYITLFGKYSLRKSEERRAYLKGAYAANVRLTGFIDGNAKLHRDCKNLANKLFTR